MDGVWAQSGEASAAEAPVKRDSPARKHRDKRNGEIRPLGTCPLFRSASFSLFSLP